MIFFTERKQIQRSRQLTHVCLAFRACVAPQYDLITLPFTVFSKFNDAMGDVYVKRSVSAFYLWGYESDVQNGYVHNNTNQL